MGKSRRLMRNLFLDVKLAGRQLKGAYSRHEEAALLKCRFFPSQHLRRMVQHTQLFILNASFWTHCNINEMSWFCFIC